MLRRASGVSGGLRFGRPRHTTAGLDIDLLIVAEDLPNGRLNRMSEFEAVESEVAGLLTRARAAGFAPDLSPVIKTPAEVLRGSPLFLDMTVDARLLFDREGFLRTALDKLKARLDSLGARRIWRGNAWYWDLKPDFKPGDVIEL